MSSIIKKAKEKAEQVDLEALKHIRVERKMEDYYILGSYPPLTALDDVSQEHTDILAGNTEKEFEVYLHVPFCDQLCDFCHFHWDLSANETGPEVPHVNQYLDNLKTEITLLNRKIGGIKARSVYVGGGTPSFLSTRQIRDLLGHLKSEIEIADGANISFDLHPNTIHQEYLNEKLAALRELGVNRIPIGGVDLNDDVLYLQHRGHKSKDTVELIQRLKLEGFDYVVTDLMMGVPGQIPENWERTLDTLIDKCEIDCAMAFPLMFKASAQIWNTYQRNPEIFPSIEDRMLMHIISMEKFAQAGYTHDPLYYFNRSDDAKSDQQVEKFKNMGLLGMGVTAFGFANGNQYFNMPDRKSYRKAIEAGDLPVWRAAKLTPRQMFERDVMFGLKLADGIDTEEVKAEHGLDVYREYGDTIETFKRAGLMESDGKYLRMTWKGQLFSEEITDHFAGDDVRQKAERVAARTSPKSPIQRYNYNLIGQRVR